MVLLYLVAVSILACLGSAQDVNHDGYSRHNYPNPLSHDYSSCHRKEKSYICDPNDIIPESEG